MITIFLLALVLESQPLIVHPIGAFADKQTCKEMVKELMKDAPKEADLECLPIKFVVNVKDV